MPHKCLEIDGLRQRLYDRSRAEEFTVYVEQPITLCSGDFVALLGPSGCGKTTLLTVLGLLRAPTDPAAMKSFTLWTPNPAGGFEPIDLRAAWMKGRRRLIENIRRRHVGFALQSGELVSSLTVAENIGAPLFLNGYSASARKQRVDQLIDAFGLRRRLENPAAGRNEFTSLASSRINRLSGGEYQRVALARSIAHRPIINFVDEPTSALNRELARGALRVLGDVQRSQEGPRGVTVMITHDEILAEEFCNVLIRMAPRSNSPAGEVVEVVRRDALVQPISAPLPEPANAVS
jgi:ABC-type lipoprotein export system ATPase subunit